MDYLPVYLIFPKGGASGVFGSILLFAIIFWSVLLSFLSYKRYWPFKTLKKNSSNDVRPCRMRDR